MFYHCASLILHEHVETDHLVNHTIVEFSHQHFDQYHLNLDMYK